MTVKEYKEYKETGVVPWFKAEIVKRFWETNPTFEQENIRSELAVTCALLGVLIGILFGFGMGLIAAW